MFRPALLLFVFLPGLLFGQSKLDSLNSKLSETSDDTVRLRLLSLVIKEMPNAKLEEMKELASDGAALSDSLSRIYNVSTPAGRSVRKHGSICYNTLAYFFSNRGDFGQAIYYQKIALSMRDSIVRADHRNVDAIKSLALSYSNLAIYSQGISDHVKTQYYAEMCLSTFDSALVIAPDDKRSKDGKAKAFILLGNLHDAQKDYVMASKYFDLALTMFQETGNAVGRGGALTSQGRLLHKHGRHAEALNKFADAIEIFLKQEDFMSLTIAYNNMGETYLALKEPANARECFQKSLEIAEQIKNPSRQAFAMLLLARADTAENKNSDALVHLIQARDLAVESTQNSILGDVYQLMAHVLYQVGEYRAAYDAFQSFSSIRDSLYDLEKSRQLKDAMTKFETEKKEQENVALQKDNKLKQAEISTQRVTRNFTFGIAILVLVVASVLWVANRQKKKANAQLTLLNEEVNQQKLVVEKQKEVIEVRQKETTDSIQYAKKIQGALFAANEVLKEGLGEHLLFFQPKDIVSGDFYWAVKKANYFYLAVCDSTGHGVPGAFMSLLNISYINEAINEKGIEEPGKIFDHVRHRLEVNVSGSNQKDGMDGIIIRLDSSTGEMKFATAFNAPIVVRGGEVIRFTPDKMPVGPGVKTQNFSTDSVQLNTGDIVYLFTDGFADQFGGEKGKKFKYKQLEELLVRTSAANVSEQQASIEKTFSNWKGILEQVDDVLLVGFRIA